MRRGLGHLAIGLALLSAGLARGGTLPERRPQKIDLATALRLAGAENLDWQIARQRLAEAEAAETVAIESFFPYLSPGLTYRHHDGNTQTVEGAIIDAHKEQYTAGLGGTAQVDLGEAIFRSLAARQTQIAVKHAAAAQRQQSVYEAALAYFDLARAWAAAGVAEEARRISASYAAQIEQAVKAGLTYKGDQFRAITETERTRLLATQAHEQERLAGTRLAQVLHLDPTVELMPAGGELAPLQLILLTRSLDSLVAEAIAGRPELKQYAAQLQAARANQKGAVYGPLVPTISGQGYFGGLGGGIGSPGPRDFDQTGDYAAGLSWRVGPGGLFDTGRIRLSEARVKIGVLELEKVSDAVTRQVVDGHTRIHSLAQQIREARRGLEAAEQTLKLAQERREFAVGAVLETIQAEQELTRVRLEFVNAVAEQNKAQYGLQRALGALKVAGADH